MISTHTPLAGRDGIDVRLLQWLLDFYSHAPRGARLEFLQFVLSICDISTHTPLAGRDDLRNIRLRYFRISTHTPLAGRDTPNAVIPAVMGRFLLTRPSRGAT